MTGEPSIKRKEWHHTPQFYRLKNVTHSIMKGNHYMPITKLILFTVSKNEWDTKEDAGNSMKNALSVQQYAKRYLSG